VEPVARRVPRAAWRHWLGSLAVGALLTAALLAALTLLARRWQGEWLQQWDGGRLLWLEGATFSFQVAIWWEGFGSSAMLVPVAATAALLAALCRRPILALTIAASYLLAKPIVLVGWRMWDRARPQVIAEGIAAPPLQSFPSGHSVQTTAIYGLLLFLWFRRSGSWLERLLIVLLWAALVALVGLARLRLGVHWPSDVIAGSLIGVAWLATLIAALRSAEAVGGR
jgi:membrane-associated phospholipid phosphatase